METTKKMIVEEGYIATNTNRIAKEANVSIGLIYKYFPEGKSEIVKKIAQRDFSSTVVENKNLDISLESFPRILTSFVKQYVQRHRENEDFITAVDIAVLAHKEPIEEFEKSIGEDIVQLSKVLSYLNHWGYFKNKDLDEISKVLVQTIDSIVHRHITLTKIFETDVELIRYLVDLILKIIEFGYNS